VSHPILPWRPEDTAARHNWRRGLHAAIAINLAAAVALFGAADALAAAGTAVPAKYDPLHRLRGWHVLGQDVGALLAAHPGLTLLADDRELLAAAHTWMARTLDLRQPGRGVGGFVTWGPDAAGRMDWRDDPSLLTGAAGVALALLAAIAPVEPAWDRVLLLSPRDPRREG